MKLTPNLLAHLRECYHEGEGLLEGTPAALDALMAFATEMLPVRDALLALKQLAAEGKGNLSGKGQWKEYTDAHATFWKLADGLYHADAEVEP